MVGLVGNKSGDNALNLDFETKICYGLSTDKDPYTPQPSDESQPLPQFNIDLQYGPINKSLYTQQLELFVKILLHKPEQVKFHIQDSMLYAQINNQEYNVLDLMRKTDFSHLSFDKRDADAYVRINNLKSLGFRAFHRFHSFYDSTKYNKLNLGEKLAINLYTGNEATGDQAAHINRFLRGDIKDFHNKTQKGIDDLSREIVLTAAVLSSGLNKIDPDLGEFKKRYRGESFISNEIIQQRISAINAKRPLDKIGLYASMMSTTEEENIAKAFSKGRSLIVLDWSYGKSIQGLSKFGRESEFLVAANSQIQWEKYTMDENGMVTFYARQVNPLRNQDKPLDSTKLEQFNNLFEFFKKQDIPGEFLTRHNKILVNSDNKSDFTKSPDLKQLGRKASQKALLETYEKNLKSLQEKHSSMPPNNHQDESKNYKSLNKSNK